LDSALGNSSINSSSNVTAEDPEAETKRQITEALFSSKKEINELETDISDSLSRSGLSNDRRSLFSKTIRQLETSSDILNKQLEQILVSDLQASREKLGGIVGKMKGSEKELQTMIVKLDRISRFLETATALIQSLSPIKPVIAKPAAKTN
jgi:chromosome segregation ATPase